MAAKTPRARSSSRPAARGEPVAVDQAARAPTAPRRKAAAPARRRGVARGANGSAESSRQEAAAASGSRAAARGARAAKKSDAPEAVRASGARSDSVNQSSQAHAARQASSTGPRVEPGSDPGHAQWSQAMHAFGLPDMQSLFPSLPALMLPAGRLAQLQKEYADRWQQMVSASADGKPPEIKDKRFGDPSWQSNGAYSWNAALYLLNAEFMQRIADSVEGDEQACERIRFATQQWLDAASPANFLATNPEAQRVLVESKGRSLVDGIGNLLSDMKKGYMSITDESAFEVGRNVATTAGAVVYQNELVQVIQYAPTTERVGSRPILLIPPCINKFYILDLQPDNSLVSFLTSEGHTVFLVSWRNVHEGQGHLGWDDYLQRGVVEPIEVVKEISDQESINVLGFCVGGTITSTALAALAARGEFPAESLTLLTTLLDFSQPGVLGVFIDEQQVAMREQKLAQGGILSGRELATTFSFLRPNDLVWNYFVNNYLKGKQPPAFDLLYWNGDSTNLPGPMYCWYLRHLYLQNELRLPNRLRSLGQPVDLGRIKVPAYVFAAREDHIVPWQAAYQTTQLLGSEVKFVLGASGHIAGTINPAGKNRRSYWFRPDMPADPRKWFDGATEYQGSWWRDWADWLRPRMGELIPAPRQLGGGRHRAIEPAPGSYVKEPA